MKTGQVEVHRDIANVRDRLAFILACANCEILSESANRITFRHGTYLANTVALLPKTGAIQMHSSLNGTILDWRISISPCAAAWMIFVAIIFCWTIFAPILVYHVLNYQPAMFMKNLLRGL
jgi:hypothetical protein